ncbi:MAG: hypothetical protein HC788_09395 [Sphingopyxis sp.]|nr:hypothetical protein [Sphingopyxis sp.]
MYEAATALIAKVECNVIAGHKSCSEISRPYKPALAIGTAGTGYTPKPVILPRYAAEVAEPFAQPVNLLPDYYDESPPNLGTSEVDAFPDMYGLGTGQPPAATTPEPELAVPADLLEGIGSPVVPSAEPAAALPG